jgi:endonuclease YncB( thermonuclease family)
MKYLLAVLCLIAAPAYGAEATNIRVIDGDTFECDINLGFGTVKPNQHIRIYSFDAWESQRIRQSLKLSPAQWEQELIKGRVAKQSLESLLKMAKVVRVNDLGQSFDRWVCEVYADGVYVADYMKAKGHARSGGMK